MGWFRYDVEAMHRAVGGEPLPGENETEKPAWLAAPHDPWAQELDQEQSEIERMIVHCMED
ncbi:MAG: hypothetical protein ETSY1_11920 [Candidatus Entotheonella factor]|uniref:Uncharacterized protein n=1 Tax=Entotheonella factor TaxID=1429438 RepID=W4LQ98_ENTF1|nr:MAG: hypothetical protein ETSY1_11920 [Candidatus Entotheonella factor]